MITVVRSANKTKNLAFLVLATWLIAAALFSLAEGVPMFDAMYWSSTTMTTVGYGDISPATVVGKIVTIFFQFWSIFVLVPLAVSNVIARFDTGQFTHAEQEWQEATLREIARKVNAQIPDAAPDHDCY